MTTLTKQEATDLIKERLKEGVSDITIIRELRSLVPNADSDIRNLKFMIDSVRNPELTLPGPPPIKEHKGPFPNQPEPKGWDVKKAGHHWLRLKARPFDGFGGRIMSLEVKQWCPSVKQWAESGRTGTGGYVDMSSYEYVAPCVEP